MLLSITVRQGTQVFLERSASDQDTLRSSFGGLVEPRSTGVKILGLLADNGQGRAERDVFGIQQLNVQPVYFGPY